MSSAHGVPSTNNPLPSPRATGPGPAPSPASTPTLTPDLAIITASRIETSESTEAALAAPARSWREVLGASLVPALAALYFVPDDPLLIQGNFPWLVLVPLLVGVQHGALAATLSSGLLLGTGSLQMFVSKSAALPETLPTLAAFAGGCVATGVIAGHYHDRVQARLSRLSLQAVDTARRLARLSRAHAVVKLSHRRLEERLAAGSWSLVSAFDEARRELSQATSLSAVAEVVLNVLSNHASVQSATLLGVVSVDRTGCVELRPSASIGNPPVPDLRHPLVQRALSTGRLVALDAETSDANELDQPVLAVAPLVAASGKVLGLVLIHELPFMAFQAENLKGLAALTALLADMIEDHQSIEHHSVDQDSVDENSVDNDSLEDFSVEEFSPEDFALEQPAIEPLAIDGGPRDEARPEPLPGRSLRAVADDLHRAARAPSPESGEGVVSDVSDVSDDSTLGDDGDFTGRRTGTHRRRSVAQSA